MLKQLIVNADDFGQSRGINQGIVEAHQSGIVTSASLMVRWPAAVEACELLSESPTLSLGLHVDLGEWTYDRGSWRSVYEVVELDNAQKVKYEVRHQLDEFRRIARRDPTHLDSHQHVHRREPVRSILIALASELQVPLRKQHPAIQYCGKFYGQTTEGESLVSAISVSSLVDIISGLDEGITELCCHPARGCDFNSMYASERELETDVLCDPRIPRALKDHGLELRSFSDCAAAARKK